MRTIPRLALASFLLLGLALPAAAQTDFVRGDCNVDNQTDIGDPVYFLAALFSGGMPPACDDSCDSNDDGLLNIADAVYTLGFLFSGGAQPGDPYPNCGSDPTADGIGCANYPFCVPSGEICDNGVDDDSDGLIDCQDSDCFGDPLCIEICDDGIDNDGDGFIDCDDLDCNGDPACPPTEVCDDGIDNDGDGFIDCDDFDCFNMPPCEICDDGVDNDGDGFVDCADFDCSMFPACNLSHAADMQPLWDAECTFCHGGMNPFAGLDLEVNAYTNIVDVAAGECAPLDFVEPFDSAQSWIFRKVEGTHTAADIVGLGCNQPQTGDQMPIAAFCCLTQGQIDLIQAWIDGGANP